MVKSKKLSRGSLAVLLLALLLSLSMVVGLTGAWFTDKNKAQTGDQVAVMGHINDTTVGALSGTAWALDDIKAVPGDSLNLSSTSVEFTANIDTFLFIDAAMSVTIQYKGNASAHAASLAELQELFGEGDDAQLLNKINNLVAFTEVTSGKKQSTSNGTLSGGPKYYYYTTTDGNDYAVKLNSTQNEAIALTISTSITNQGEAAAYFTAEGSSGVHNWEDATITFNYYVKAYVIQANHHTGNDVAAKAAAAWGEIDYYA